MFNITSREQVIVNTWYGGEMKKGMFSMMNYYLPLKGIASMHCSANTDMNGENTAILSACPEQVRLHFPQILRDSLSVTMSTAGTTMECSTSRAVAMLRLSTLTRILSRIFTMQSREMLFLRTLHLDAEGKIDFADKSVTENTRVSYPINHIEENRSPDFFRTGC